MSNISAQTIPCDALFLFSNPLAEPREDSTMTYHEMLDFKKEQEEIAIITKSKAQATYRILCGATKLDLLNALAPDFEGLRLQPRLLHVSCHAEHSFDDDYNPIDTSLLLESKENASEAERLSTYDLQNEMFLLFEDLAINKNDKNFSRKTAKWISNIQIVILNCCQGNFFAEWLINHLGIQCVIASSQMVPDAEAIRFFNTFYKTIFFGKTVNVSLKTGATKGLNLFKIYPQDSITAQNLILFTPNDDPPGSTPIRLPPYDLKERYIGSITNITSLVGPSHRLYSYFSLTFTKGIRLLAVCNQSHGPYRDGWGKHTAIDLLLHYISQRPKFGIGSIQTVLISQTSTSFDTKSIPNLIDKAIERGIEQINDLEDTDLELDWVDIQRKSVILYIPHLDTGLKDGNTPQANAVLDHLSQLPPYKTENLIIILVIVNPPNHPDYSKYTKLMPIPPNPHEKALFFMNHCKTRLRVRAEDQKFIHDEYKKNKPKDYPDKFEKIITPTAAAAAAAAATAAAALVMKKKNKKIKRENKKNALLLKEKNIGNNDDDNNDEKKVINNDSNNNDSKNDINPIIPTLTENLSGNGSKNDQKNISTSSTEAAVVSTSTTGGMSTTVSSTISSNQGKDGVEGDKNDDEDDEDDDDEDDEDDEIEGQSGEPSPTQPPSNDYEILLDRLAWSSLFFPPNTQNFGVLAHINTLYMSNKPLSELNDAVRAKNFNLQMQSGSLTAANHAKSQFSPFSPAQKVQQHTSLLTPNANPRTHNVIKPPITGNLSSLSNHGGFSSHQASSHQYGQYGSGTGGIGSTGSSLQQGYGQQQIGYGQTSTPGQFSATAGQFGQNQSQQSTTLQNPGLNSAVIAPPAGTGGGGSNGNGLSNHTPYYQPQQQQQQQPNFITSVSPQNQSGSNATSNLNLNNSLSIMNGHNNSNINGNNVFSKFPSQNQHLSPYHHQQPQQQQQQQQSTPLNNTTATTTTPTPSVTAPTPTPTVNPPSTSSGNRPILLPVALEASASSMPPHIAQQLAAQARQQQQQQSDQIVAPQSGPQSNPQSGPLSTHTTPTPPHSTGTNTTISPYNPNISNLGSKPFHHHGQSSTSSKNNVFGGPGSGSGPNNSTNNPFMAGGLTGSTGGIGMTNPSTSSLSNTNSTTGITNGTNTTTTTNTSSSTSKKGAKSGDLFSTRPSSINTPDSHHTHHYSSSQYEQNKDNNQGIIPQMDKIGIDYGQNSQNQGQNSQNIGTNGLVSDTKLSKNSTQNSSSSTKTNNKNKQLNSTPPPPPIQTVNVPFTMISHCAIENLSNVFVNIIDYPDIDSFMYYCSKLTLEMTGISLFSDEIKCFNEILSPFFNDRKNNIILSQNHQQQQLSNGTGTPPSNGLNDPEGGSNGDIGSTDGLAQKTVNNSISSSQPHHIPSPAALQALSLVGNCLNLTSDSYQKIIQQNAWDKMNPKFPIPSSPEYLYSLQTYRINNQLRFYSYHSMKRVSTTIVSNQSELSTRAATIGMFYDPIRTASKLNDFKKKFPQTVIQTSFVIMKHAMRKEVSGWENLFCIILINGQCWSEAKEGWVLSENLTELIQTAFGRRKFLDFSS